jgi:uncharacterized protein (UPF0303 family)
LRFQAGNERGCSRKNNTATPRPTFRRKRNVISAFSRSAFKTGCRGDGLLLRGLI